MTICSRLSHTYPDGRRLQTGVLRSSPADACSAHPDHTPAHSPSARNSLLLKRQLDHVPQDTDRQGNDERREQDLHP